MQATCSKPMVLDKFSRRRSQLNLAKENTPSPMHIFLNLNVCDTIENIGANLIFASVEVAADRLLVAGAEGGLEASDWGAHSDGNVVVVREVVVVVVVEEVEQEG